MINVRYTGEFNNPILYFSKIRDGNIWDMLKAFSAFVTKIQWNGPKCISYISQLLFRQKYLQDFHTRDAKAKPTNMLGEALFSDKAGEGITLICNLKLGKESECLNLFCNNRYAS